MDCRLKNPANASGGFWKENSEIKKLAERIEEASPNIEILGIIKAGEELEKALGNYNPDLVLNYYWEEVLTKGFIEKLEKNYSIFLLSTVPSGSNLYKTASHLAVYARKKDY